MAIRDTVADLALTLDLPAETVSDRARVTLTARCQAVVEHHGGLMGYADDHVEVGDGPGRVKILGSGLVLRAMDRDTLIVTGRISGVEYA